MLKVIGMIRIITIWSYLCCESINLNDEHVVPFLRPCLLSMVCHYSNNRPGPKTLNPLIATTRTLCPVHFIKTLAVKINHHIVMCKTIIVTSWDGFLKIGLIFKVN